MLLRYIKDEFMKKYRYVLSDIKDEVDDVIDDDKDLHQKHKNYMVQFLENIEQDELENENR